MSSYGTVHYGLSNNGGPQLLSTEPFGAPNYLRSHRQAPRQAANRLPGTSYDGVGHEARRGGYNPPRSQQDLQIGTDWAKRQDHLGAAAAGGYANGYREPTSKSNPQKRPPGAPSVDTKHRRNGPLLKLTQGLLKTYKAINKRYYEAKKVKEKQQNDRRQRQKTDQQNLQQRRNHHSAFSERAPPHPSAHAPRNQPAEPGPAPTRQAYVSHGPAQATQPVPDYYQQHHGHAVAPHSAPVAPKAARRQQFDGAYHQAKPEVKTHKPKPPAPKASKPLQVDTPDHDYIVRPGDILNDKYRLEKQIDKGCFGVVVLAYDLTNKHKRVAIKIIKAKRAFFKQAQTEIDILSHLNYSDQDDSRRVVRLFEVFIHKNHRCLVFELLSHSLYKLLKDTNFKGVSLTLVRKFTYQLLISLQFLRVKHPKGIVHADLKPENILLVSPERSQIKVIDFGSSCFEDRKMYSYIQSRFYRAPEVLLGKVYSYPIDMWSLGCILIELHTGEPVFPGLSEEDQLCKIIGILGMPPKTLLHRAKKKDKFFIQTNKGMQLKRPPPKKKKDKAIGQSPTLPLSELKRRTFEEAVANARRRRQREVRDHGGRDYEQFLDLIKRMLVWEPDRRISPTEALQHPWLAPLLGNESGRQYYGTPASNQQWPGLGSGRRQGAAAVAGQAGAGYIMGNPSANVGWTRNGKAFPGY